MNIKGLYVSIGLALNLLLQCGNLNASEAKKYGFYSGDIEWIEIFWEGKGQDLSALKISGKVVARGKIEVGKALKKIVSEVPKKQQLMVDCFFVEPLNDVNYVHELKKILKSKDSIIRFCNPGAFWSSGLKRSLQKLPIVWVPADPKKGVQVNVCKS